MKNVTTKRIVHEIDFSFPNIKNLDLQFYEIIADMPPVPYRSLINEKIRSVRANFHRLAEKQTSSRVLQGICRTLKE